MSAVRTYEFGELVDAKLLAVGDGYRAKNEELGGDGPIFLRAGHVGDGVLDLEGVDRFIGSSLSLSAKASRPGDVLVVTKGWSTGRVAYVSAAHPPMIYSPHTCFWRALDHSLIDPSFLRYWSRGHEAQSQLASYRMSTDVHPYLSLVAQRKLKITVPALDVQRAAGRILGALDDKIELNRRTNETLEAMARAIFQSWFVDFDPVRAKMEGRQPEGMDAETAKLFPTGLAPSALGFVPAGWEAGQLSDLMSRITDGAHASPPSVLLGGKPMASVKDMTRWGIDVANCRRISAEDFRELERMGCSPERGDILLAKDGARCLETACEFQQEDEMVLLSSVAILRPTATYASSYIDTWLSLESTKQYLKEGFVSGSAIPRAVLKDLKRANILVPPSRVLERYDSAARVPREMIRNLWRESQFLAALRDTLLPKLLSGELRVPDAERAVAAAL